MTSAHPAGERSDRAATLVRSACSGDLRAARRLLAAEPELGRFDFYTACATGEFDAVARMISTDPSVATRKGGPLDREPVLYACYSRFLRVDPGRAVGIVRIVEALLGNGADPNSHYLTEYGGRKEVQTVLFAAAG